MTEKAVPLKVAKEENLRVTLWENKDKTGNVHKNVKISMGYPTKATKDLPKEQREYEHKDLGIALRQVDVLIGLLQKMKE